MSTRRPLEDEVICRILDREEESEDDECRESDSEAEDHLSEDEVQSDYEEGFIDDGIIQVQETNENQTGSVSRDEDGVVNPTTGKPEMILFYNQTKGGVDTLDQMCSTMTCSRKTNRWPMAVIYGILNIAFLNSYIIYCHNMLFMKNKPLSRKKSMKQLSSQLTNAWMTERLEALTLPRHVRSNIESVLPIYNQQISLEEEEEPPSKNVQYEKDVQNVLCEMQKFSLWRTQI